MIHLYKEETLTFFESADFTAFPAKFVEFLLSFKQKFGFQ